MTAAPDAVAQGGELELSGGASYSLPPASVSAEATPYVDLGARLLVPIAHDASWYLAGQSGLSLISDGASWISGSTGAWWAIPLSGGLFVDLQASGEAFSVGDPWPYRAALAQGEPALRLEAGTVTVRAAAWGGVGRSWVDVAGSGTMHDPQRTVEIESELWAWGGRLEGYLRVGSAEPRIGLEAYTAPQGDYAGGRVGVRVPVAGGLVDLDFGVWDTPDGSDVQFAVRLQVPIGGDVAVRAYGGRFGPDPLLDTPVAGSAGASIGWTVSRFGGPDPPVYTVLPGSPPAVQFRLVRKNASTVSVVGSFSEWQEVPLRRHGEGWVVTIPVEPGLYRFGFLVDGAWTVPDEMPDVTQDEWGVRQVTLVVPGT